MTPSPATPGQRGPAEHERREQIVKEASAHFRHYGYSKTTVVDLAKAVGLSAAYVYKFFESKQAIGDAVCTASLSKLTGELQRLAAEPKPVATRLRSLYRTVARHRAELFLNDRRLHELAVTACTEGWQATQDHQAALLAIIRGLIEQGRDNGEFERKTPIAETSLAIRQTLELYSRPRFLNHNLDGLEERAVYVAALVLRSLRLVLSCSFGTEFANDRVERRRKQQPGGRDA